MEVTRSCNPIYGDAYPLFPLFLFLFLVPPPLFPRSLPLLNCRTQCSTSVREFDDDMQFSGRAAPAGGGAELERPLHEEVWYHGKVSGAGFGDAH